MLVNNGSERVLTWKLKHTLLFSLTVDASAPQNKRRPGWISSHSKTLKAIYYSFSVHWIYRWFINMLYHYKEAHVVIWPKKWGLLWKSPSENSYAHSHFSNFSRVQLLRWKVMFLPRKCFVTLHKTLNHFGFNFTYIPGYDTMFFHRITIYFVEHL